MGGFTMVEIAIALAVIAFALVAIIGVLPMGMNVQKENRQETLLNQDGQLLLEAIRNGAQGLEYLTNYVEWVSVGPEPGIKTFFHNPIAYPSPVGVSGPLDARMVNAEWIIGLLSIPKYIGPTTNKVTALMHSISGAAAEEARSSRDLGFTYHLIVEVVPFSFFQPDSIDYAPYKAAYDANPSDPKAAYEYLSRLNRANEVKHIAPVYNDPDANLYEVKLTFRWPVKPDGSTGPRRQQVRALISSHLAQDTNIAGLYLFQAQEYIRKP